MIEKYVSTEPKSFISWELDGLLLQFVSIYVQYDLCWQSYSVSILWCSATSLPSCFFFFMFWQKKQRRCSHVRIRAPEIVAVRKAKVEENFMINYFGLTIKWIIFLYRTVAVLIEKQKMLMFWFCLTFLSEVCSLHCSDKLLVFTKSEGWESQWSLLVPIRKPYSNSELSYKEITAHVSSPFWSFLPWNYTFATLYFLWKNNHRHIRGA